MQQFGRLAARVHIVDANEHYANSTVRPGDALP